MPRTFYGRPEDAGLKDVLGLPGIPAENTDEIPGEVTLAMLQSRPQHIIGTNEIREAASILEKYKSGKANLEQRVIMDELWYKLRHWEVLKRTGKVQQNTGEEAKTPSPEPASAWLFNAILNKHADAMDNYPEPIVLPREQSDEKSAKILQSVLPVIMENNGFEQVYSDGWWKKLKHGTAVYGVFWDSSKENGLGDLSIQRIDLLNLFWEPGITDLQKSRNIFITDIVDADILDQMYPEHAGDFKKDAIDVAHYIYDETVDTSEKVVVVDWYYKVTSGLGKQVLHYCKFAGDVLLYASENDPQYRDRGWYDHGQYPIVADNLFPEEGTPVGFGYVAICKDPQLYIDKLSSYVLESAMMHTKPRYFVSSASNVNIKDFLDWNKPIVQVEGELNDNRVKPIVTQSLDGNVLNVLNMKIDEMKDTAGNRDVNSGGKVSGVTAASAIAALQEAGNKTSRDMISASYRSYTEIVDLCIELIRQFYDEKRAFRITGDDGTYSFEEFSNEGIKEQPILDEAGMPVAVNGIELFRKPVFDLKTKAQRRNPFSRMEQNERAKELYQLGFFNPERAQETLPALDMMEFEGIDKVREQVKQGATLLNICRQLQEQNAQLIQMLAAITGQPSPEAAGGSVEGAGQQMAKQSSGGAFASQNPLASGVMAAQTPQPGYAQRLAKRSTPSLEQMNTKSTPGGN